MLRIREVLTQTKKETSDNARQAPVEGTVTQDTETKKEPVKGEVQTEVADDNVVVGKHDKPYLALGADLTAEQTGNRSWSDGN